MNPRIKTSHGITLLGACLLLAVVLINSASQQFNQFSKLTAAVSPRSQLAQVGGAGSTVIFLTSGTTWTVPSDWNSANNKIEVIGGGGGGDNGVSGNPGGGGGGGAYSLASDVPLTVGATVGISIGSGGTSATNPGGTGGNTYLCNSTSNCGSIGGSAVVVGANGGSGGTLFSPGAGGSTSGGVGSTLYAGGSGGGIGGSAASGSGGGGAAGPSGAGSNGAYDNSGSGSNGGAGDNDTGGSAGAGAGYYSNGGSGGNGTEWTQTSDSSTAGSGGGGGGCGYTSGTDNGGNGGSYGGGGGGSYGGNGATGSGAQGIIVITYTPTTSGSGPSGSGSQTAYTITSSAGSGGYISPSGSTQVNSGSNQTFSITANSGYYISSLIIDSSSISTSSSYTFTNVTGVHSISVSFAPIQQIANQTVFFVRSGANGNGTSWANAWGNFSNIDWTKLGPGKTLCIAGGTYTSGLSIGSSGAAGNPLVIKRAVSSDPQCGSSNPDWNSSYDSQVLISVPGGWGIAFHLGDAFGNYVTIDGVVNNGIKVSFVAGVSASTMGVVITNSLTGVTLRSIEIAGPGTSSGPGDPNAGYFAYYEDTALLIDAWEDGSQGWSYYPISNLLVSHCSIHGAAQTIQLIDTHNSTFEYNTIYDAHAYNPGPQVHPNVIYTNDSSNIQFKYNDIYNWDSEGILLSVGSFPDWYIYDNVWHDPIPNGYPRIIESQSNLAGPIYMFNNTISGINHGVWDTGNGGTFDPGSESIDNLTYIDPSITTYAYNMLQGANSIGNILATGTSPFVGQYDYHLKNDVMSLNTGMTIPSLNGISFNVDKDGNIRPSTGPWDIGAYQYSSTPITDTQAPTVPTDLATTSVTSSSVVLHWNASTDNYAVAGYKIYRNGSLLTSVTSGTTYTDSSVSSFNRIYLHCIGIRHFK